MRSSTTHRDRVRHAARDGHGGCVRCDAPTVDRHRRAGRASFVSVDPPLSWDLSRLSIPGELLRSDDFMMGSVRPARPLSMASRRRIASRPHSVRPGPVVYAFWSSRPFADLGHWTRARGPIGRLTERGVRYFSRNIGPGIHRPDRTGSPPGAVWYVGGVPARVWPADPERTSTMRP